MSENVREDLQEQVLGVVRKSEELTLATVKKVVGTLSAATARLPVETFAGKLHQLPLARRLPDLPALPEAGTVVKSTFDFAGRLLAEQRTFAEELVQATAPLRPRAKAAPETPETPEDPETLRDGSGYPGETRLRSG